jgi:F-type H+-transporting ATPase subunit epsilon
MSSEAAKSGIKLEVLSPNGVVFDGQVEEVIAPARLGEMGVLAGHEPLVALLEPGTLTYRQDGQLRYIALSGGFLEATAGRVLVLATTAERSDQIDIDRARRALQTRQDELAALPVGDTERPVLERAMARARARMAASDLEQKARISGQS